MHTGSLDYNYKHYFSIVLLGICDANYNFTYIYFTYVGAYGKRWDLAIFKDRALYANLIANSLNIPDAKPLIENNCENIIYMIVGDVTIGLHENLMKPRGCQSQ